MAQAQGPTSATVLSIGDGDTIRVQQGAKRITIRLACIDAPEMAQAPDGANARSYLQSRLRLGSSVTLRPQTVDRFGRTVAEVIRGPISVNLQMVEQGEAAVYRQYLSRCDRERYLAAEGQARLGRRGIWGNPPLQQMPWDFRRCRREGGC
ncbi:thermonuclease family protein [Synechococcus sp. 1G10]|uniref:thermonuclease family protein n=1 Tax=Synechococcus sp. 1G10 TaxID=2025605 RepID=UPI000B98AB3B|nr:thermonuclease family protein [Synechococcus sp. 1G10]